MKKMCLTLFSLLMIFALSINVLAAGAAGDGSNTGPDKTETHSTSNWLPGWDSGRDPQITIGFRISFTTSDGEEWSVTDYILQENKNSGSKYQYTSQQSKVNYATTGDDVNFNNAPINFGNPEQLQSLFKTYGFNMDLSDSAYVIGESNGSDHVKYAYNVSQSANWFEESNYTSDNYEEDLKGLLSELLKGKTLPDGTTFDVNDTEQLKNLHMTVEPTTMIHLNNTKEDGSNVGALKNGYYYGTVYELANQANKFYEETKWATYGHSGVAAFTTLFNNMICASYLSGSVNDAMNEQGITIDGFTEGSYFGSISTDSGTYCTSNKKVPIEVLLSANHGIGLSETWFYDKIGPNPEVLTCALVNELSGVEVPETIYNDDEELINEIYGKFIDWFEKNNGGKKYENEIFKSVDDYIGMCTKKPPKLTCSLINEHSGVTLPDKFYKTDVVTANKVLAGFQKWADENRYQSTMTAEEYLDKCVGGTEEYECEPIGSVGMCDSSGVTYNDNDGYDTETFEKQCVLGNPKYAEGGLSQNYCSYYCYEELDAKLMSNIRPVNAGRYIEFDSYINRVSGSRKCITQVDVEGYKSDIEDAQDAIIEAWAQIKYNEKYNAAIDNISIGEECCMVAKVCTEYKKECPPTEEEKTDGENSEDSVGENQENVDGDDETTEKSEEACVTTDECIGEWVCPKGYTGNIYSYSGDSVTITADGKKPVTKRFYSYSGCLNRTPDKLDTSTTSYDNARKALKGVVESMYKCYNGLNKDNIYNLQPVLNLDYSDGVTYEYNSSLGKGVVSDVTNIVPINDQNYDSKTYTCSGTSCTPSTQNVITESGSTTVRVYEKIEAIRNTELRYSLSANTFNYITKYQNYSQHDKPSIEYIKMGSNLPVSYSAEKNNHLSILYSKMGHSNGKVDAYLSSKYAHYGNWACNFKINPGLIETKGIKLIYRTIDLNNPFPDINGEGRKTGSNWCSGADCSNTNRVVDNIILSKKDILNKEPMYSFILTPSTIKKIRNYNKGVEEGYLDFNLKCENETGNACISSFITEFSPLMQAGGKCIVTNARVAKSDTFYGCKN